MKANLRTALAQGYCWAGHTIARLLLHWNQEAQACPLYSHAPLHSMYSTSTLVPSPHFYPALELFSSPSHLHRVRAVSAVGALGFRLLSISADARQVCLLPGQESRAAVGSSQLHEICGGHPRRKEELELGKRVRLFLYSVSWPALFEFSFLQN